MPELVKPKIGDFVAPDGWQPDGWTADGSRLEPSAVAPQECGRFWLPVNSRGPIRGVEVRVLVSGRVWQRRHGRDAVRVRIEFLDDDAPPVSTGGWLFPN